MKSIYDHLLEPHLYSCPQTAKFIDAMTDPEIDSVTDQYAEELCSITPPLDDMINKVNEVSAEIVESVKAHGVLNCCFKGIGLNQTPFWTHSTPIEQKSIEHLFLVGKSLAFGSRSFVTFFASEIYHIDNKIIFRKRIPQEAKWGLHLIGSSIRGNSFEVIIPQIISEQNEIIFDNPVISITRTKKSSHPLAKFYEISDTFQMESIVSKIPALIEFLSNSGVNPFTNSLERDIIINFMTVMKALSHIGYKD